MTWNNAKTLLVTTATMIVASQVVKNVYKYLISRKSSHSEVNKETCDTLISKSREIYDVILFPDDIVRYTTKIQLNKDIALSENRELNCFKLIKYIKSARETLDVCMYMITSNEIAEQIVRLGQKHVLVRIVVDSDMAFESQSQIKRLKEYSFIEVQMNKKSILMHHKFCIIDGPKAMKRKSILKSYAEKLNVHAQYTNNSAILPKNKNIKPFVMSGSLNWSTQAMISNHESVIVTSHPNIVSKFEKEFESLWLENEPIYYTCTRSYYKWLSEICASDLVEYFFNICVYT
ncbi:hypothetical protein ACJJTC_018380 [Scirpophaga incertulas]